MRTSGLMCNALIFFVLASPSIVLAQFQKPTDEELKMTADPKAPGADAVYLNRDEVTDDNLHSHTYYERIKVLTEKGKEQATIRIPSEQGEFKVAGIEGRTIHTDGTIVPLAVKAADLMEARTGARQADTMVFTFPSVEVGSILEYRLKLHYGDKVVSSPTWKVQQPFFVHKAHYVFSPSEADPNRSWPIASQMAVRGAQVFANRQKTDQWDNVNNKRGDGGGQLAYTAVLIPQDKVVRSDRGVYSLDLTDVPPLPNEDWMPPFGTIQQSVEFYYTDGSSGKEFWESAGKSWTKGVERFTNPSDQLKKTLEEIVVPADSEEQKARKIYAAVEKLDNSSFRGEQSGSEPKAEKPKELRDPEEVWKQRSGSEDEISLLFVAMARAAGLKAWPMQVVDRDRADFNPGYLAVRQLDDYIAVVEIAGREVYLDPGQKMCPFGLLHWKHASASGFRLADNGAILSTTPENTYKQAVSTRTANVEVASDGSVTGTVSVGLSGQDAFYWRQLALENDLEEIKRKFNKSVRDELPEGVQAEVDHFIALDNPDLNLLAVIRIGGKLGTVSGNRISLPSQFFGARTQESFAAQDKRIAPIDLHYAQMRQETVTYSLPAGYTIESMPRAADLNWPNHAMLKSRTTAKDGAVEAARVFANSYSRLEPSEYSDLHNFYLKVADADQQKIVLSHPVAVNGN
jgi:hypothetical protein